MNESDFRLLPSDEFSWRLEAYLGRGGYAAARKAVTSMAPVDIIGEVRKAGLRGRGGAGFPAGLKWSFVPQGGGGGGEAHRSSSPPIMFIDPKVGITSATSRPLMSCSRAATTWKQGALRCNR